MNVTEKFDKFEKEIRSKREKLTAVNQLLDELRYDLDCSYPRDDEGNYLKDEDGCMVREISDSIHNAIIYDVMDYLSKKYL